ncbi:MAG: hypothetical protein NTZ09_10570, partial [Candidatus Hydrogenedentes bacterium]|nr:hypothetical protein [Candidatus Hydrogenedentota bacterium]
WCRSGSWSGNRSRCWRWHWCRSGSGSGNRSRGWRWHWCRGWRGCRGWRWRGCRCWRGGRSGDRRGGGSRGRGRVLCGRAQRKKHCGDQAHNTPSR